MKKRQPGMTDLGQWSCGNNLTSATQVSSEIQFLVASFFIIVVGSL